MYATIINLNLIVQLHSSITHECSPKEDEFELNKDAGMYVCKAGHMAFSKSYQNREKELINKLLKKADFFNALITPMLGTQVKTPSNHWFKGVHFFINLFPRLIINSNISFSFYSYLTIFDYI